MRFDKSRQFEVLTAILAAVDERGSASLAEFDERFEVEPSALHSVVAEAVLCEFRTKMGEVIGFTRSFLLTEDEHLVKGDFHWLRDLVSVPPDRETALRLLVAGTAVRALRQSPDTSLEKALGKLRGLISAEIVIADERPEWLPLVERAVHAHRRVRFRYVKYGHSDASDREIEPHVVYKRWEHWYVEGRPVGEESTKQFRIDRIIDAEELAEEFEPPDTGDILEWFDLSAVQRTLRLRLPESELESIPRPFQIGEKVELPGGIIEVDVTVAGDRHVDHVLVALGPECEVIGPPDLVARRREHAAELLALYN